MDTLNSTEVLGLKVTAESEKKILEHILDEIQKGTRKISIFTPNPEIIMYARTHPTFKTLFNKADISIPDGVGVLLASILLGHGIRYRVTGVDLMEKLCKALSTESKSAYSVGFFGGLGGVAEKTAECLQKKYSGLNVSYCSETWDDKKIKAKKIDVLFVAMGCPKQEQWISENLAKIPVTIAMGVGGAFDFISGEVKRAPFIVRFFGFEWLYRLIVQPWRWKRQLALISFSILVFKEMFKTRLNSKTL